MDTKRRTTQQASVRDEQHEKLAMLGMSIRKLVSEGYKRGDSYNGLNYGADGYTKSFNRQPLPSHMDQPPSLMGAGSTVGSSSSFSSWDQQFQLQQPQLQVIGETDSRKRKAEANPDLSSYQQRYGELAFDEDF